MSGLAINRHLLAPRPGRLFVRMCFGALLPLVVTVVSAVRSGNPIVAAFCSLVLVAQIAAAVTTAHKEILAASPSFFHAGLRRRILTAQAIWALLAAIAVVLFVGLLHPAFGTAGLVTAFAAALGVHAALALAMLHLWWGFQLPFWLYYFYFLLPWLARTAEAGQLDGVVGNPLPWLASAAVLLGLLSWSLISARLHRRLCGSLVLGADDLFRPGRVQQLKQQRRIGGHAESDNPLRRLIPGLLARATAAREQGRSVAARAWQLLAIDVAANATVRGWVLGLIALGLLGMMLFFGYYDGRAGGHGMNRWFSGLVFQWAAFPFFSLGLVVLSASTVDVSRRTGFAAEVRAVARMAAAGLVAALLTAALFAALAEVLPPVTWRGCEYMFTPARPHCIWLVPLVAPFAWLVVALRPRPQCTLSNIAVNISFLAGHAFMNEVPYATSVPIFVAVSGAVLVGAYLLRRRWWLRADLGQ